MKLQKVLLAALLAVVIGPWSSTFAAKFDVLELPAVPSALAAKSMIFSIKKFDDRYFATGHQGHILYSDDGGDTWTQAQVPVRSSILDIDFPTPELGWAVGHEGVILHSSDGGKTWVKQYDGVRYGEEGKAFYQDLADANPDNDLYPYLVGEMDFAIGQGADKPLFRVRFHSATHGHAAGAYGMILVTRDGGQSWGHVLHNMENDSFYHLFDFSELPEQGKFFISGEAGLLLMGDVNAEIATQVHSVPWEGSFFTSASASDGAIIMGGLRGRMFRTEDIGHTWTVVEKPPTSSIVDSTRLLNDNLVFAGMAGEILLSTDDGNSFARLPLKVGGLVFTVSEGPAGTLLLGGPSGIHKLSLPQ
ncbi:MAG: YCF48-related protein [Halioglobus sp.]